MTSVPVTLICVTVLLLGTQAMTHDISDDESVRIFREYVQINTTTGNDLSPAVEFWRKLAADENVSFNIYEYQPGYPVIVLRWPGEDSSLRSIMLNSHMDVVTADINDGWTYPPFSAELVDGVIWGRGTNDMKSVSIQYYTALRRLRANNVTMLRDVYMTLMPDEETLSPYGMNPFLRSKEFAAMRIGIELDEGQPNVNSNMYVVYQDKVAWQIQVDCYGATGHGATMRAINTTAAGQCMNVINTLFSFRERESVKYLEVGTESPERFTSINLNRLNGGIANNILPGHVSLVFDIRLSTTLNEAAFEEQLNKWMKEAGENVTLTFLHKDPQSPATILSSDNPYWVAMQDAAREANLTIVPRVIQGSTDARYVRNAGYPAFGFIRLPNALDGMPHSVNEKIGVETFLEAIPVYEHIIKGLANVPAELVSDNPRDYLEATA